MRSETPYLVIRKRKALADWRVHVRPPKDNNGRKVLVNEVLPKKERVADNPEWEAEPATGHTPVVKTGLGGLEVATFTEEAGQDCHLHFVGTEVYTVLQGTMSMKLNRKDTVSLRAGDEIVVLPGTPHEVLRNRGKFLTRVHTVNCYGTHDKYVRWKGEWCHEATVKRLRSPVTRKK